MLRAARIELVARRALDDRTGARVALRWYSDSLAFASHAAAQYGFPVHTVAGVLAALSPMQEWKTQLSFTGRILAVAADVLQEQSDDADGDLIEALADRIPGPGFKSNKRKASAILCGADPLAILSGPKVRAFFASIVSAGSTDAVCVDRHAWNIADGEARGELTAKRYRDTVAAYVSASATLRAAFQTMAEALTPANVQALTWVWWRDNPGDRF